MAKFKRFMNIQWLMLVMVFSHVAHSTDYSADKNTVNSAIISKEVNSLIKPFSFEAGKGIFKQSKSFTFMSMPIVSHGNFIVDGEQVLWETTKPVNSALLLTAGAVYKKNITNNSFQLLVKESPINHMLSAILTGNIDLNDWSISKAKEYAPARPCISMLPKSQQLMSIFTSATLCMKSDNQREVLMLDKQKNKTLIEMDISHKSLTVEDKLSLEIP